MTIELPASHPRLWDRFLSAEEIFAKHAVRNDEGCLVWPFNRRADGYALINYRGKRYYAHRLAYLTTRGDIPRGRVIDHMCHNEAALRGECEGGACRHHVCVEPAHLRCVTYGENSKASPLTVVSKHLSQTECLRGHAYTEENTYTQPGTTSRTCRTCKLAKIAEYKERQRAS